MSDRGRTASPSNTAIAEDVPAAPSVRYALAGLSCSMLLSSLSTSSANVALPTLMQEFGATFQQVQWVVVAYLLAITTLIVSAGRLGDIVGRKRLLLAGLGLFVTASALCSASPWLGLLIAARAAQGLGASVMMALTMAFVGETVPKDKTGSAMGLLGTTSAIGTALGPTLGGVLITGFGWPAIFLVNAPLGLLTFWFAWRYLPSDNPRTASARPRFDAAGTLLLAATLGAYALAMTLGRGHFGVMNGALLLIAAAGTVLFTFVETGVASPLVRPAMFRDPALSAGLATSFLVSVVIMTTLIVGPFYLSRTLRLEPYMVGIVMSAGPLVAALTGIPAGRIVDYFGTGRMAAAGLLGTASGCAVLSIMPAEFGVAGYAAPLAVMTAGYALFQTANNTAVMGDVERDRRGVISGMLNLSRNLGLLTGASAMGAVFSYATAADIMFADAKAVEIGTQTAFAMAAAISVIAVVIAIGSRILKESNGT
jgi:EmrB/QacA subfamily drug resistance transporter